MLGLYFFKAIRRFGGLGDDFMKIWFRFGKKGKNIQVLDLKEEKSEREIAWY